MNSYNKETLAGSTNAFTGKNRLRQAIQLVLAGSVLASGMASAVLQDRGPGDPLLTWPQWYRDTTGLAVGLCKSQAPSPNALAGLKGMCFPPAPDPAGFAGNIGPEMFYNMISVKNKNTGSDFVFNYIAGLEASYLPAGVPVHGTETVFARIRISFNFNDPNKSGKYVVTHPFGVETFDNVTATTTQNLVGNKAAIFFTIDVPLGGIMNFDGALAGRLGPFLQWDVLQAGESLTTGGSTFLGDPNFDHTFTGSPFGTNFVRVQGPLGSNLDGLGNDFILMDTGAILGQVWGAPIAQPLAINAAYESRSPLSGVNSIDVWATSSPNQRLILTGTNMPSLQLFPDGTTPGKYHGHIEYPSNQPVPATVTVTNLTSIPVNSVSTGIVDGVEISQASFNTNTRVLAVKATTSDQVDIPKLAVQGIPGVPSAVGVIPAITAAMTALNCSVDPVAIPSATVSPSDVCFVYTLPAGLEPPESVSVLSSDLGQHADNLVAIVGGPENPLNPPVATDFITPNGFNVKSSGSTVLTSPLGTLPLDAQIISQPLNGTIALVAGQWQFTANTGALAGPDSFQYVRQSANNAPVSNVANASLTLTFQSAAPIANLDQFAATTSPVGARKLFILGNDKPASANAADVINPASVTIVTPPARGTFVKNADGTISYTATSGGSDSFSYTVKNSATPTQTSNTAIVQLTNFTGIESVSVGKVNYSIAQDKWVIVGGTNWFGPNLTQTVANCWTGTAATPTASTLIGSAAIDTTGKFQIATLVPGPVGINNQTVTCQTSYGGKGAGATVAK